jgi:hypothetical protein
MYEPAKVTIFLYKIPEKDGEEYFKKKDKVFQKTFIVDSIEVNKFDSNVEYKSKIKLKLIDILDTLYLNKIMKFSNFNLEWKSNEMNVDAIMHKILRDYESKAGKIIIKPDLFGVTPNLLKRRFMTDCQADTKTVFYNYLDSLYDVRWNEYLTNDEQKIEIPKCMIAFTNHYTLTETGILKQRPYLVAANALDKNPDTSIYSIPYPESGKINNFAKKDYKIFVEDTKFDLRGNADGLTKSEYLAFFYRWYKYNPKLETFNSELFELKEFRLLNQMDDVDIETRQKPKYHGIGADPKFLQVNHDSEAMLIKAPTNIKDNKLYFSSGENSLYSDICKLALQPQLYVTLKYSAWHSPGQEIDLKLITYSDVLPEKSSLYSLNKLISGRWKILNSITILEQNEGTDPIGLSLKETVGVSRMKYFYGDEDELNPNTKDDVNVVSPKTYSPTLNSNGLISMNES